MVEELFMPQLDCFDCRKGARLLPQEALPKSQGSAAVCAARAASTDLAACAAAGMHGSCNVTRVRTGVEDRRSFELGTPAACRHARARQPRLLWGAPAMLHRKHVHSLGEWIADVLAMDVK